MKDTGHVNAVLNKLSTEEKLEMLKQGGGNTPEITTQIMLNLLDAYCIKNDFDIFESVLDFKGHSQLFHRQLQGLFLDEIQKRYAQKQFEFGKYKKNFNKLTKQYFLFWEEEGLQATTTVENRKQLARLIEGFQNHFKNHFNGDIEIILQNIKEKLEKHITLALTTTENLDNTQGETNHDSNELALTSTVKLGAQKLEVPLYKMTKEAFQRVYDNVFYYCDEDAERIITHAMNKYGLNIKSEQKIVPLNGIIVQLRKDKGVLTDEVIAKLFDYGNYYEVDDNGQPNGTNTFFLIEGDNPTADTVYDTIVAKLNHGGSLFRLSEYDQKYILFQIALKLPYEQSERLSALVSDYKGDLYAQVGFSKDLDLSQVTITDLIGIAEKAIVDGFDDEDERIKTLVMIFRPHTVKVTLNKSKNVEIIVNSSNTLQKESMKSIVTFCYLDYLINEQQRESEVNDLFKRSPLQGHYPSELTHYSSYEGCKSLSDWFRYRIDNRLLNDAEWLYLTTVDDYTIVVENDIAYGKSSYGHSQENKLRKVKLIRLYSVNNNQIDDKMKGISDYLADGVNDAIFRLKSIENTAHNILFLHNTLPILQERILLMLLKVDSTRYENLIYLLTPYQDSHSLLNAPQAESAKSVRALLSYEKEVSGIKSGVFW